VGQQVDDEGGTQPIVDALVGEQVADIEQVARMLPSKAATILPAYRSGKDSTSSRQS
jgi:hypothetical protein